MMVLDQPARVRRACRILLGSEPGYGAVADFGVLDRPLLKKIYRRQALARHPDRVGGDGQAFSDLHEAWRLLDGLLAQSPNAICGMVYPEAGQAVGPTKTADPAAPRRRPNPRPLPAHALRFGQYLVCRGLITREELIKSLVWQGRMRPAFGRVACNLGYLGEEDPAYLLLARLPGELFGDAALRLGFMDNYQRLVVLGCQRRYQAEIGRYFLDCGLLEPGGLEEALAAHRRHNLRYPVSPGFRR